MNESTQYSAIYCSDRFQELKNKKRKFLFNLTLFFTSYFLLLPILTSLFPKTMSYPVFHKLPFAWLFAFSQFIMTGLICIIYFHRIKKFDHLAEQLKAELKQ